MKIGVFGTFMSPISTPDVVADFGRRAEDAGIESIWMGEHVVLFDEMEFGYPGTPDGKIPVPEGGGLLDTVPTFSYLAAVTKNIRFGTGIALISQRNPVYTANEFATLDYLSGGRVDFGIGVGWCKEEVIACGYSWEDRGARSDEFLELTQSLWTNEITNFDGKHFQVKGARLDPKPVQKPHIPIIVGGHSKVAFRRAARFGTGWYGFGVDPATTKQALAGLDATLGEAGKSRDGFEIVITPPYQVTVDMVREYADLGVDRLIPMLGSQKKEKVAQRFGELEGFMGVAA